MKRLAFMVGRFQAADRAIRPGGRAEAVPAQQVTGSWMLGGQYLRYVETENGKTVAENVIGSNPTDHAFRIWEFYSSSGAPQEFTGRIEGDTLVFGRPSPWRPWAPA